MWWGKNKNRRFCLVPTYRGIDKPPFLSFCLLRGPAYLPIYSIFSTVLYILPQPKKLDSVIYQNEIECWSDDLFCLPYPVLPCPFFFSGIVKPSYYAFYKISF